MSWTALKIRFDGATEPTEVDSLSLSHYPWQRSGSFGFVKLVDTPDLVVVEWQQVNPPPPTYNRFLIAWKGGP